MKTVKRNGIGLLLAVMALLMLGGCGQTAPPVEIVELNVFSVHGDGEKIGFFIKWKNVSRDKVVDTVILSVRSDLDNQPFECQIFEPDGIRPGLWNNDHLFFMYTYEMPQQDAKALSIAVSEVCFTDGSRWEAGEREQPILVEVDGHKGEGEFPARLHSACFYEDIENSPSYRSLKLQVDWTNTSETNSIIDVMYKITGKSIDGNDTIYFSSHFSLDDWVSASSDYNKNDILDWPTSSVLLERDSSIYELSIWRVVDSKGIVWENPDSDSAIKVVMRGKKGFAFDSASSNASVQELIGRIAEETEKQGLDLGVPEVSVKEQDYCLLRYADVDVRVELSKDNEVYPHSVRLACYLPPSDMEPEPYLQELEKKMESLRICMCAAVLTDLPYTEVIEKVDQYNHDHDDIKRIEFSDTWYNFGDGIFLYDDEEGETGVCGMFTAGKGCLVLGP